MDVFCIAKSSGNAMMEGILENVSFSKAWPPMPRTNPNEQREQQRRWRVLLYFDSSAGFGQFFLDVFRLILTQTFFDGFWRAFDEILRFFEA
jgi:hypothetical protein